MNKKIKDVENDMFKRKCFAQVSSWLYWHVSNMSHYHGNATQHEGRKEKGAWKRII